MESLKCGEVKPIENGTVRKSISMTRMQLNSMNRIFFLLLGYLRTSFWCSDI